MIGNPSCCLFFARESVPNTSILSEFLFDYSNCDMIDTECSIAIIKRSDRQNKKIIFYDTEENSHYYQDVIGWINENMNIGDVLMASRDAMYVMVDDDEVSLEMSLCPDTSARSFHLTYQSKKRDPGSAMEFTDTENTISHLLFYDGQKDKLYEYNRIDGEMSHGYIRGVGFFIHKDLGAIRSVIQMICHTARDGMNLWEDWYGHPLDNKHYREIDLDSGFMRISEVKEWGL